MLDRTLATTSPVGGRAMEIDGDSNEELFCTITCEYTLAYCPLWIAPNISSLGMIRLKAFMQIHDQIGGFICAGFLQ